jgi:hypothetical protein
MEYHDRALKEVKRAFVGRAEQEVTRHLITDTAYALPLLQPPTLPAAAEDESRTVSGVDPLRWTP